VFLHTTSSTPLHSRPPLPMDTHVDTRQFAVEYDGDRVTIRVPVSSTGSDSMPPEVAAAAAAAAAQLAAQFQVQEPVPRRSTYIPDSPPRVPLSRISPFSPVRQSSREPPRGIRRISSAPPLTPPRFDRNAVEELLHEHMGRPSPDNTIVVSRTPSRSSSHDSLLDEDAITYDSPPPNVNLYRGSPPPPPAPNRPASRAVRSLEDTFPAFHIADDDATTGAYADVQPVRGIYVHHAHSKQTEQRANLLDQDKICFEKYDMEFEMADLVPDLSNLTCPLSCLVLREPIQTICGGVYEKGHYEAWLCENHSEPMRREGNPYAYCKSPIIKSMVDCTVDFAVNKIESVFRDATGMTLCQAAGASDRFEAVLLLAGLE